VAEGDGVEALLKAWIEGWERLAAAQRAAADALVEEDAEGEALWRAAETQFALWRAQARAAAGAAESRAGFETLSRFLDPGQWLYAGPEALDPALKRLIDGPPPGDLGDFGRAGLSATPEWKALRRAASAHRRLVAGAWGRVVARAAATGRRRGALRPEALHAAWLLAAEAELDALHRSEAFAASQARLVSAAVALRAREAALVEAFCEARALPTRREIDDLTRAVAELRRELRALKRELGRP
jgi:hypothetical protein